MTARNRAGLDSQVASLIPTNGVGQVTAANVRSVMDDVIDSAYNNTDDINVPLNVQTGISYTIQASDANTLVTLNNAASITVTLPNNLTSGFTCTLMQLGAGQVTVSAAAGAAFVNSAGHTKTAAQYSLVSLAVYANSGGSAAQYVLTGDSA